MTSRLFIHIVTWFVCLAGCSYSPRNNTALEHATSEFPWSGALPEPNVEVILMTGDGTQPFGLFDFLATTRTSSTVTRTDAAGVDWYGWSVPAVRMKQFAHQWRVIGPRRIQAKIRTVTAVDFATGTTSAPLPVFDAGRQTDRCISNNEDGGGLQIIEQCQSLSSGIVTLTAPCGTRREACCGGTSASNRCDGGLACSGDGTGELGTCLGAIGTACSASSDCVSTATCRSGVCTSLTPPPPPPPRACARCNDGTCQCGSPTEDLCRGHGGEDPELGCIQQP